MLPANEQGDVFPRRIRWLAIATGVAAALALFPVLFLFYPVLLIAGAIVQPRFPIMGKWFVWAGAANLGVLVITYDALMFPHPWKQVNAPEYFLLAFAVTTALLIWCCGELVVNGIHRMRARRSMPPAEPRTISHGVWIFAAILNLMFVWGTVGLAWGIWHEKSGDFRVKPYAMSLVNAIITLAFDISLTKTVVHLRRFKRPRNP